MKNAALIRDAAADAGGETLRIAANPSSRLAYLAEEFFRAVSQNAGITLHLKVLEGRNDHHQMEAMFKAFGLALRQAMEIDPGIQGVLSTKGILD